MADAKSSLDGALFAFRARQGGLLLGATATMVVFLLASLAAWTALNFNDLSAVSDWYGEAMATLSKPNGATELPLPPAALGRVLPSYLILNLVVYLALACYEAACLKWLIRGDREGVFGLSLGPDMWRVYAGYWTLALGVFALYWVAIIAVVIVQLFFGALSPGLGGTLGLLVAVAAALACVYALVRLAPGNAASVGLRRFAFFEAWGISRGRFLELLGAFMILFLGYMLAYIVLAGAAAAALYGGAGLPDPSTRGLDLPRLMAEPNFWIAKAPALGAFYVLYAALTLALLAGTFGVNARAVLQAIEGGRVRPD